MTIEAAVVCDGCSGIIEAASTGYLARQRIRANWPGARVALPGGRDFCPDCVKNGYDKRTEPSDPVLDEQPEP